MLKKSILASLLVALMVSWTASASVQAATASLQNENDATITTVGELEKEISNVDLNDAAELSEARENILENTDPEVLEEYGEKLQNEVTEATNELADKLELTSNAENPENQYASATTTLDDGTVLEVNVSDTALPNLLRATTSTEKFGARSYKVESRVYHVMYPDGWICLLTFYNVGKSGLTATGTSVGGTRGLFPLSINASSKITDKRAEKNGYDINGQGDYTLNYVGTHGIGIYVMYRTLVSTVKLNNLYASSAKVTKSFQLYK
ncbi:hypothetical protein [Listeria booriae]|uniref:hypothetical protein n=1 Tax=Listeria booriae TaxID=1552123 RepID=UPI001624D734|nr:hypothetical protein [Listeria booriae]MBC2173913.1 hypothetical protein [Listeria booriae]